MAEDTEKLKIKALVNYCMVTYGENAILQGFADFFREMANDIDYEFADAESSAQLEKQASDIEAMLDKW